MSPAEKCFNIMDIPDIHLKVVYDFEYETKDGRKIQIIRGEKLFLLNKTNSDWWQVIRNSNERPFYVPASYVVEISKYKGVLNNEKTLQNPLSTKNHPEKISSPEIASKEELTDYGVKFQDVRTNCGSDCDVEVFLPYLLSDNPDMVPRPPCDEGCCNNSWDGICEEALGKKSEDCSDARLIHQISSAHNSDRSKTPEFLSDREKCSNSDCADSVISSVDRSVDIKLSEPTVAREKIKTSSSSLEKLLLKFRLMSSSKHKDMPPPQCDPLIRDLDETGWSVEGEREIGTYPRGLHVQGRNKLSYSRSFETRRELKNSSVRKHRKSHLSSSWEGKGISSLSLLKNVNQPHSVEDSLETHKNSCNNDRMEIASTRIDDMRSTELISSGDLFLPVPPLAFQNSLYLLSHPNEVSIQSQESTESLDGYLDEDGVSDSGASFLSSELLCGNDVKSCNPGNTISEDAACGSCDDIDNSVPVPFGWKLVYDEVSGEPCYINRASKAKWFLSTDREGRVYYFEENSAESSWTLPKISIDDSEVSLKKSLPEVPTDTVLRGKEGEKRSSSRITKARSLLVNDKKQRDSSNKSSSIPRNFLVDKSAVLKEGPLNRTKITENGKKVRKNWAIAHVVLREQFLVFLKESKSVQPELVIELNEVVLESGEKMSKRKNVFLVSTAGLQVLCQAEDSHLTSDWCSAIKTALENLNKSSKLLSPHSPDEEQKSSLVRSRSLRNRTHDGNDDQMSGNEEQTKIRNRLKRFFHRRPTRETLASKGIYKDEPVFDNYLEKVCSLEHPRIPKFVLLCVRAIEGKEENMKTDGLYRASGNLSHVQKIRLEVDQNNLQVLEKEDDVHVLTGALKLFFRELKEPLIPFELFTTALETGDLNSDKKVKIRMFQDIVQQLPDANRDTLAFLLRHLRKVTEYEEYNRMHIPNLAIVFGPTLIWREKECHQNMALEYMQQNLVIEFFLQQFDEIFRNFKLPNS